MMAAGMNGKSGRNDKPAERREGIDASSGLEVEGRVLIEERTEGNETMQYTERATKTSS